MPTPPPSRRLMRMFRLAVVEGIDREQVASRFKIRRATLDRNIRRVEKYLARGMVFVESTVMGHVHLERLEHQWQVLMTAWRSSTKEQIVSKAATDKDGNQRAEVTRKQSDGDPRFLEQARRVLSDMRALVGVEQLPGEEESWNDVQTRTINERLALIAQLMAADGHCPGAEAHVRADFRGGNADPLEPDSDQRPSDLDAA